MAYCVSNMFGIRTGGVFSDEVDMEDMKKRINEVSARTKVGSRGLVDMSYCTSAELTATKGSYVVIAGVFNYFLYEDAKEFAKELSKEFQTDVMHMCWDEERDTVQCNIWCAGEPILEIDENPIGKILRRIG